MVGYFDELSAAVSAGIDEAGLHAIAGRHAMEVVGPVPEEYLWLGVGPAPGSGATWIGCTRRHAT